MTVVYTSFTYYSNFNIVFTFIFTVSLCQNTPQLASAVEITMCGQMYLDNGNYEEAIKKYNIGLNLLDGFLEKEPPGIRYDLLNKHVSFH